MADIDQLATSLGVRFNDRALLESALIHRSYLHEHPECGLPDNERLEFLGDSILNYLVAAFLYQAYPEQGEGELTALRAALVQARTLSAFARQIDLGTFLLISKGEERNGARARDALLADTFEALVAAISTDQGMEAARAFLLPFVEQEVQRIAAGEGPADYKTRLQELVQGDRGVTPRYETVSVDGPDHRRQFTVDVLVGDERVGRGIGPSKQSAAMAAAAEALASLGFVQSPPAVEES
jgi:ribonuclease-3